MKKTNAPRWPKAYKVMSFKDEGEFYTTKLLPDGSIPDPYEMYEWGTLKEKSFFSKAEAIKFAQEKGVDYEFE